MVKQSSDSLAGRIGFYPLGGFTSNEIPSEDLDRLWVQGSFPRSFLAETEEASMLWREYGVEIKYSNAPKTSKSMHTVIEDLNLEKLIVNYSGKRTYHLTEKIIVRPFSEVKKGLWFLEQ